MPLTIGMNEQKPGLVEIALGGRLDTETSPQLEKKLDEALAKPVQAVRFELSRLDYISSMGIRVLFKAMKALRAKKAMFLVVNPQPQIKKVLEIAQALPKEAVFASIQEADAYFDIMQKKVLGQGGDES
jgi:anti-anti-sigma factor